MKFACDKCETKYSIADEKVRGKVLKIRCKKCENIIVLKEPKSVVAEAPPPSQAAVGEEQPTRAVTLDPATLAQLRAAPQKTGSPAAMAAAAAKAQAPAPSGGAVIPKQAPVSNDSTRVVSYNELEDHLKKGRATAPNGASAPAAAASSRSQAAVAQAAPRPQPAPQPKEVAEWYLAVGGQQVGPMTPKEVEQRIANREADERTYGWRDGMGDWKRIADIPELKGFLQKRASAPPPPPPPPPPVEDQDPPAGAEVVDFRSEVAKRNRTKVPVEQMHSEEVSMPGSDGGSDDPLAAMMAEAAGDQPDALTGAAPLMGNAQDPFASVPSSGTADGPPRESTRMFIAAAGLANRGQKHKVYAVLGTLSALSLVGVLYLDYAGIYEIPIAHDLVSFSMASFDVERPPPKKRVVDDDDSSWNPLDLLRKKEAPAAKKKRSSAGGLAGASVDGDETDLAAALKDAKNNNTTLAERKNDDGEQNIALKTDTGKSLELKGVLGTDQRKKVEVKVGGAPTPEQKKAGQNIQGDSPIPPEQIMKVVSDQKSSLNQCAMDAAKAGEKFKGTALVTVTIGPSGKVKKVLVNDAKLATTTLGECLGRALMRWVFPRFEGEPFDAELPLKLSVGP